MCSTLAPLQIVILPPSLVIYLFYNLVATITPHFEEVSPYSSWIKFTKVHPLLFDFE